MARHAIRQQQRDDLAFPVRVKVHVPPFGMGKVLDAMHGWLQAELGPGQFACHNAPGIACDTVAFYFRNLRAARAFVGAFPDATLADGTLSPAYGSAVKRREC